jgi:zinc transport system substrate-binding protein
MNTRTPTTHLLPAALTALTALLFVACIGKNSGHGHGRVVVASFYPMYIAALNITEKASGVKVVNMAAQSAGCLHDYQLTPADAALLEGAGALVINGGGAEEFLDKAAASNANLVIIYASENIVFISDGAGAGESVVIDTAAAAYEDYGNYASGDSLAGGAIDGQNGQELDEAELYYAHHQGGPAAAVNIHVWMSVSNHIIQVENIAKHLSAWDTANAAVYIRNAGRYIAELAALREASSRELSGVRGRKIVISHDGFAYLANELGLVVAAVVEKGAGVEPSAADIIATVNAVKREAPRAIFTESARLSLPSRTVAAETGLPVFELDMAVSGPGGKDSYLRAMESNVATLKRALE